MKHAKENLHCVFQNQRVTTLVRTYIEMKDMKQGEVKAKLRQYKRTRPRHERVKGVQNKDMLNLIKSVDRDIMFPIFSNDFH
jgi:hypothetical protein